MYSPQYDRLHQILQKYKPVEDPLIVIAETVAPVEAPITDAVTPKGNTKAPQNDETSDTLEVQEIPKREEDVHDVEEERETGKLKGKIKEIGCHASFIKKLRGCLDQNGSTHQIQALQNQFREVPIQGNEFEGDNEDEDLIEQEDQDWEDVEEFHTDNEVEDDDSIEKGNQDEYPEDVEDFQGHEEDEDEDVIEKENLDRRVKDDIQIYVEDLIHDILCFRNSSESEKSIHEENIKEDKEIENEDASSEQGKQDNDPEENVEDLIYDLLHFASNRTSNGSEITETSIQGEDVQVDNEVVNIDTTEQEKQYEYAKSVVENHDILISKLKWFLDQSTLHIEALEKKLPGSPKVEEEFEKENENENVDVAEEEKEAEYTEEQAEDHATFINKLRGFLDQIQALQNHVREIPIQGNEFEGENEDVALIEQEDQDWEDVEEFHTDNEIEDDDLSETENQDICTDDDVKEYQRDKEKEDKNSYEQENQNRFTDDYGENKVNNVIHDLLRFAANSSSRESEINEMSTQEDNEVAGKDTTEQEKKDSYTESVVENHDILLSKLKGFLDQSTPHVQTLQKQSPEIPIAIPEANAKENKNDDGEKAIVEENEDKCTKEQIKCHTSFIRKLRGFLDQNGSTHQIRALQNQVQEKEYQGDNEANYSLEQENQNISSEYVENVQDDNDVEDEDATDLRWFLDENNSIHHIRELQKQIRIQKENVQIDKKDVEEKEKENKCTDDMDEDLMQDTDKDLPGEHRRNTEDDVDEDLVQDENEKQEEDSREVNTQEKDTEFEDDVDEDLEDDDNDDKKEDLPGMNAQADVEDEDKSVDLQGMKEKDVENAEDDESVSLRSRLIFTRKLRWFLDQNSSSSDTRVLKKQTTRQILNDYIRDRNEH